jgi:hypothetical protein
MKETNNELIRYRLDENKRLLADLSEEMQGFAVTIAELRTQIKVFSTASASIAAGAMADVEQYISPFIA